MLDAIPAATLPLCPGLGQAPNMLACIPSGVVAPAPLEWSVKHYLLDNIHAEVLTTKNQIILNTIQSYTPAALLVVKILQPTPRVC